eukprot:Protomagalhaensia_sp_Gyna_25__815@NODE_1393_length_1880_cov_171_182510_g1122_i0_p2_GENE_NODE_1393_length_1880_cov_171_182510_g1122_i0NODE_1393_length_1880_cov_171_182510_g1122_i0_p2_ORF_typecomplete_len188_score22_39LOR/PF04525_12/7_7e06_NODE_1393_length_1880_cov_171_182510_g1122_i010441607
MGHLKRLLARSQDDGSSAESEAPRHHAPLAMQTLHCWRKGGSWKGRFFFIDAGGLLRYYAIGRTAAAKEFTLFNRQDVPVAHITEKFGVTSRFIISVNGTESVFSNQLKLRTKKLELTGAHNWIVEGDFWGQSFTITTMENHPIAYVSHKPFSHRQWYSIHFAQENQVTMVLVIVLCIDHLKKQFWF